MTNKHKSEGGGIHVAIHQNASGRWTTFLIPRKKLENGRKLTGCCVHHVGGTQRATLTAKRKASILKKHKLSKPKAGVRCKFHVNSWKGKCSHGAM